jgi:drug/metabolite transporter (DMT)-like permease
MPPRLGAFLAVVFWGLSFVATKAALRELSPITLVTTRFALGVALLLFLLRARRVPLLPPREAWGALALMGFVGVFFHQILQSFALTMTGAINAGWLIGLTPLWSAALSAWLLRERFPPAKLAGLALGFTGAALVVTRGELGAARLALPTTKGDLLILASTLNWAAYTVLGHSVIRRLGPTRATAGAMLAGWFLLLPPFALTGAWAQYARLSAAGWCALLFLGIACSGLGYLFWYGALERIEATRVASFLYLEPLVTLTAAVLLLGEHVSAWTVMGGLLLLGGVALVQRA